MMRGFAIAADVAMGLILGAFVYAAISGTWKALHGPWMVVAALVLGVLIVLFRRPNGSLARRSAGQARRPEADKR